ncbi:PREDICTED: zinc finger protein 521-like isoform X4 [Acromyrmex echinatior]|uniref:zinc finger protein 521-like isoform X4 n=1 Tax=Acromyrmex echinatior TaxID=103372 RepID=UPI000580F272|nr:PREDICTED: zinc finger protein 521-like isoform X4 [Acromyrmex echinatior]
MVKNCRKRGEYNYSCAEKRGKSESGARAMFPAAGKGERRSLRGSARLSSKMSGKLPRLRVLRPRQQHQRRARTTEPVAIVDAATSATPKPEGNLKGTVASHEVEHDVKKNDAKKGEDTFASGAMTADTAVSKTSEMDEDDNDSELTMTAVDEEATTSLDGNIDIDVDVDVDIAVAVNSEETINIDTNERASYECKTCKPPKMLSSIKAYFEHLRKDHKYKGKNEHSPVENRCPACSYVALNVKDLENHQRVHHLKRKFFRCAKCDYVTHIKARYAKHVKYHSMPMIKCDACDFSSAYKWNLDRHMRNHGGGGAFKCRACNFTADIRQSLTVHESYHHDPPVGQINKNNNDFERKPRNSPRRYNQVLQVGASDFREALHKSGSTTTSAASSDSFVSDHSLISIDDKKSALANAECIALKCEEKGCQFITAWDSEMQRHLAECHAPVISSKPRKPLPMLIPLSLATTKSNNTFNNSGPSTTLLKVPRVRVRPELAQIAKETELAKMYGNKGAANSKRNLNTVTGVFERKNASFFDKLKEKLTTTATSINNSVPEVAVSNENDLKCWCTFKASSMEELTCHKQTHHTALSVSVGTTRCPKCRRRCKSTTDLQMHMQCCHSRDDTTPSIDSSLEKVTNRSDIRMISYRDEFSFPSQMEWDANLRGSNFSGPPVEQQSWDEDHMEQRSIEEANSEELSSKLLIVGNKEYVPMTSSAPQSPITILSTNETNQNSHTVDRRPPPPLKAAVRNRGQSLLKNNPITMHVQTSSGGGAVSISTAIDESKRTQNQWRCKRCNYRDSNKDNILLHVKSHYESTNQESVEERNSFSCEECPFSASDAVTLSIHKKHHRPNLDAIFKCYLCPYYVSTKAELLEHARLHGEELAAMHQQNMDFPLSSPKSKQPQISISEGSTSRTKDESSIEQVIQITSRNNVTTSPKITGSQPHSLPSLLLDTRALPDAPLVWVSRPDGTLTKMLKCRHCPYISSRRAEVRDHETMHVDMPTQGPLIACTDCSFTCTRREVMIAHTEMHTGSLGTVHCLFDQTRPDSQQVSDLITLLGLTHTPMLGTEPDLQDSRLVHCCGKCPARFLCEKELRIHLRYHTTLLAYSCQWCSYAARQPAHLLAHQKAHSSEYQERTKYLLTLYGHSQRYPPPTTACVEVESRENNDSALNVAWIVVEINENSNSYNSVNGTTETVQRTGQVFTCAKCPARYFKLDALEYHMTLHGSNNRYKCNDCDYSSKTEQNLLKHQVVHRRHNETSQATAELSSTIDSASTSSPGSPLQSPPDPQFGVFMRGNPNFVYPGYLRNGRLKEKRYKCHKCPSAFEKREQYRVHLTLHGAKQRYRCTTCDYSVKYYANYVQHLRKHQANAEAQASRRQFEDDRISIDSDSTDVVSASSRKSSRSSAAANMIAFSSANNASNAALQPSNQDKQSLLLMQKKGIISSTGDADVEMIRCQSCPFSTIDKDVMDSHKRRHGIERMTPPCPHCDYIPRKDENVGEHIKLHFTRLYKPESYLIVEMLTLTTEKISANNKNDRGQRLKELLFKECADGRFLPLTETINTYTLGTSSSKVKTAKEKIIIDSNTGETKHRLAT